MTVSSNTEDQRCFCTVDEHVEAHLRKTVTLFISNLSPLMPEVFSSSLGVACLAALFFVSEEEKTTS